MKAFVTGGGGFIGKEIVRQLRERGDDVVSFQRGEYPELAELGATAVRGDITDADAVREAMAGCDCAIHVAALVGEYLQPEPYERINVGGTKNVVEACVEGGVGRLVYCSTPSVAPHGDGRNIDESVGYADRYLSHYPRTKAEAERLVLAADGRELEGGGTLRTTAVRPRLVLGPGDPSLMPRIVSRLRAGRMRVVGDGTNQIDITAVDNAALAHVLAADALAKPDAPCAGKPYFISNGEPVQAWPWFNSVLERSGLPRIEKHVSVGAARFAGKMVAGTWKLLGKTTEPPVSEFAAIEVSSDATYKLDAARRDLGYEPRGSMAELEDRIVTWLKAEVEAGRL